MINRNCETRGVSPRARSPASVRSSWGSVPDQYRGPGPLGIDGDRRQPRSVRRDPTRDGPLGRGVERRLVPEVRVDHVSSFRERVPEVGPARSSHGRKCQILDQVAPQDARRGGDVVRLEVHHHPLERPRTFVTQAEQASWSATLVVLKPLDDGPSFRQPAAPSGMMAITILVGDLHTRLALHIEDDHCGEPQADRRNPPRDRVDRSRLQ